MGYTNATTEVVKRYGDMVGPYGVRCDLWTSPRGQALVSDGAVHLASVYKDGIHIYIYGDSMSVTRELGRNRYLQWCNDEDIELDAKCFRVFGMDSCELALILHSLQAEDELCAAVAGLAAGIAGVLL